jgi:hypothetical protein
MRENKASTFKHSSFRIQQSSFYKMSDEMQVALPFYLCLLPFGFALGR